MATSGTINQTLTARQICALAAQDLGVYSAGETLSAADADDMMVRLSWMLKSWAADGVNLWRETEGEAEFPANTTTVTLDPFVLDVIEARLVQSATYDRPLQRWELGEYLRVPNRAQTGYPSAFYTAKSTATVTMSVWPVPSTEMTVKYTYSRVTEDVTDLSQTLDIPQIWLEAVWTNLAVRCATLFGATRIDPVAVAEVTRRAAVLEQKLLDNDRPASVFMGSIYTRGF